jgi:hypothetical protein
MICTIPEAFHNILYYPYTGVVVFATSPEEFEPTQNAPKAVDVHAIYAAADQFLLTDLKEKALAFLITTCNVDNITSRVFGECAKMHDEVTEYYDKFFRLQFSSILKSPEYRDFFQEAECRSAEKRAEVYAKFRDLAEVRITGDERVIEELKKRRRVDP